MKYISLLLLLIGYFSFSQEIVHIDSLNKIYSINPIYADNDDGENIGFEEIKAHNFTLTEINTKIIGKEYWSSFILDTKANLEPRILEFKFELTDRNEIYAPLKNGKYKIFALGLSTPNPRIHDLEQTSTVFIDAQYINFEKPFYVKNKPMSIFGLYSINIPSEITLHSSKPLSLNKEYNEILYQQNTFDYKFILLIGMIMISFVFMFIHFIITKHDYFFYYSMYLFFLIFNYGYRTFFFYNVYSEFHEYLYFYLNQNGQLLANLFYILFIKYFINIKVNYPKLYPVYNFTLWIFFAFIVVYNTIIIINPFFEYHEIIMKSSIYSLSLLSMIFVFYMFFNKRLVYTAVVFIGSIILLFGYIAALVFGDFFVLVPLVVIETILFISVIAYLDLRNFKKGLEADKLSEIDNFKTRFFTNISHELRTPLTLIHGPLEDQLTSPNLSEKDRNNLKIAVKNTSRLKDLVDQLLELSRIESGNLKLKINKANLPKFILAQTESFSNNSLKKNIAYKVDVEKDEIMDWFDKDTMEKILFNLIGNAIKYTPENGEIIIKGKRKIENFIFEIMNSGSYIPECEQKKIFDRYYQTSEHNPGTGIGLAMTKELVELHHGTLFIKSEEFKYTTFTVSIPTGKDYYDNADIVLEENLSAPKKVKRISEDTQTATIINEDSPVLLIVDDNQDILNYVSSVFESSYVVHTALNGKNGFKVALNNIPDIVISDVMMPEQDGFEFTKNLKEHQLTSHIPIILLTAKSHITDKLEGMGIGADAYMTKPFSSKLLKANVENLLESRKKLQQRFSQEVILMPKDISISSAEEQFLEQLEKILDQEITNPDFSADELSSKMNFSRMQFHRKIKALTGKSTSEFIRFQRLKLAAKLLQTNNISISEVGYAVGFNNPSYFTKCFKKEFGCSPSDYTN